MSLPAAGAVRGSSGTPGGPAPPRFAARRPRPRAGRTGPRAPEAAPCWAGRRPRPASGRAPDRGRARSPPTRSANPRIDLAYKPGRFSFVKGGRREAQRVKPREGAVEKGNGADPVQPRRSDQGLHLEAVRKLLEVLHALVDQDISGLVIEHNLEVIKTTDWVMDLGPGRRRRGRRDSGGGDPGPGDGRTEIPHGQYLNSCFKAVALNQRLHGKRTRERLFQYVSARRLSHVVVWSAQGGSRPLSFPQATSPV